VRAAVVIPTYNEEDNLPTLAERLLSLSPRSTWSVVDDGSPDGTGQLADEIASANDRFHAIHRTGKRGNAAASKEGLALCLDGGSDAVATMDADLSHDPSVLPRLISAVEAGRSCHRFSLRRCGEIVVDWGPFRRAVSRWQRVRTHDDRDVGPRLHERFR
jgi:dolichol-phosphate mannosyltransferase